MSRKQLKSTSIINKVITMKYTVMLVVSCQRSNYTKKYLINASYSERIFKDCVSDTVNVINCIKEIENMEGEYFSNSVSQSQNS